MHLPFTFSKLFLLLNFTSLPRTVIDHGVASVEMLMEEALQDIPPLVKDIQERLRRTSHDNHTVHISLPINRGHMANNTPMRARLNFTH